MFVAEESGVCTQLVAGGCHFKTCAGGVAVIASDSTLILPKLDMIAVSIAVSQSACYL